MLKFYVFISFVSSTRALTPPRIIYGGWTPILPGHPFYFGPVHHRKNVEQSYDHAQGQYPDHDPQHQAYYHGGSGGEPPVHQIEHQIEHQQQFDNPGQYNNFDGRPEIYPEGPHEYPPNKENQISYGHKPHNDINAYYPHQSIYDGPKQPEIYPHTQVQAPNKGYNIHPGHEPPQDIHTYRPHQSLYEEPKQPQIYPHNHNPQVQSPNDGYNVPPRHNSPKDIQAYINHQSVYDRPKKPEIYSHNQAPKSQPPNKVFNIPPGNKSPKNIFSYYPPQSVYDTPKLPQKDYKPVYFEVPKKPLDIFENPQQHISYIPSLKDVPIKNLKLHNLNTLQHGDEKILLKLTPLGNVDPNALKSIGQLDIDQIQHLNQNVLKFANYPIIKGSPVGIPRKPAILSYDKLNDYKSIISHVPYDSIKAKKPLSLNVYKGTDFPGDNYQILKRPLNPIETKYFRKSPLQLSELQQLKSAKITLPQLTHLKDYSELYHLSDLPLLSRIPTASVYPTKQTVYSDIKYLPSIKSVSKPYAGSKNLLSPAIVSKSLTQHMKKYFSPKYPHFNPVRPFYSSSSKFLYPPIKYRYNSLSKNLGHLPLRTLSKPVVPKVRANYLHKDIKLQTLYKNPNIVASIQGNPALVDKEVTIIHVPADDQQQYVRNNLQEYPEEKEYLFYTASTPETTQIRDEEKSKEGTLKKKIPQVNNNTTYTRITLDYGKDHDLGHITFVNPTSDVSGSNSPENDNSISDPPYQNQFQYIFVSSNGINGDIIHEDDSAYSQERDKLHPSDHTEGKKQFFHAYYAPADHIAPPGYVRMTVQEFNSLFKNAEIRYVDKDPTSIAHSNEDRSNQRNS